MKFNFKKLYLIFTVIILVFNSSSCTALPQKDKFVFQEGKFVYTRAPFELHNDIKINRLIMTFTLAEDGASGENIIENRKDKKVYHVDFYLEDQTGRGINCTFTSLPNTVGFVDCYYIKLDVSEFLEKLRAVLNLRVEFFYSDYYIVDTSDKNNILKADEIYLNVDEFLVDGKQIKNYEFPNWQILLQYKSEK